MCHKSRQFDVTRYFTILELKMAIRTVWEISFAWRCPLRCLEFLSIIRTLCITAHNRTGNYNTIKSNRLRHSYRHGNRRRRLVSVRRLTRRRFSQRSSLRKKASTVLGYLALKFEHQKDESMVAVHRRVWGSDNRWSLSSGIRLIEMANDGLA